MATILRVLDNDSENSISDTWIPFDFLQTSNSVSTLLYDWPKIINSFQSIFVDYSAVLITESAIHIYLNLLAYAFKSTHESSQYLITSVLIFFQMIVKTEPHLGKHFKSTCPILVGNKIDLSFIQAILKSHSATILEKSEVYLFLSVLGHSENNFQPIFKSSQALELSIKDLGYKSGNASEHTMFLFTVVDAIWSLGIRYHENEAQIMDLEGVFTLISFLKSTRDSRFLLHVSRALIDLLDNTRVC